LNVVREEFTSPVGFAKEPSEERRRWVGRVLLIALVIFVGWLFVYRVLNPADESPVLPQQTQESFLPAAD
jgi:hypothetical protein